MGRISAAFPRLTVIAVSWIAGTAACGPPITPPPPQNYVTSGLSLPPSGPHAVGPMTAPHRLAVEGSAAGYVVRRSGRSMEQGAPGNLVPALTGRARLAYGISHRLELGSDFTYADQSLAEPVASDAEGVKFDGSSIWQLDATLRAELVRSGPVSFLMGVELGLGPIRYTQFTYPPRVPSTSDSQTWVQLRGEEEILYRATARLSLSAGISTQRFPLFYRSTVYFSCGYDTCSADNEPAKNSDVTFATPFMTLSYRLGHLTLLGRAEVTFTASPDLRQAVPEGGGLSIRYTFDRLRYRRFGAGPPRRL